MPSALESAALSPAHGLDDLRARFGAIEVRGGAIIGPPGWESRNMHTATDLPGWPRLYLNNAIEAPLRAALAACLALADGYEIRTLGCFAPRCKRVNGDLSVHSWGLAVDINSGSNPLAAAPGPVLPAGAYGRDLPDAWVACFEAAGWTWGGRFHRADPMHFQWCAGY